MSDYQNELEDALSGIISDALHTVADNLRADANDQEELEGQKLIAQRASDQDLKKYPSESTASITFSEARKKANTSKVDYFLFYIQDQYNYSSIDELTRHLDIGSSKDVEEHIKSLGNELDIKAWIDNVFIDYYLRIRRIKLLRRKTR